LTKQQHVDILKIILKHGKQDKRKPKRHIRKYVFFIGQHGRNRGVFEIRGRPAEDDRNKKQQEEIKTASCVRPDQTRPNK
jgi:hypothetical protein